MLGLLVLLLVVAQPSSALWLPQVLARVSARTQGLRSRDASNTTTIPAPISVSPSQYWDGNDGPWSSFALQVGHLAQNIRVFPSVASTTTWTVSPLGCPSFYAPTCPNDRGFTFNPNTSLTWQPNTLFDLDTEVNLGRDENDYVGFDTVTLGWQGSGGPTVDHSIVFTMAGTQYWVGILGLNPRPTNFSTFVSPQTSLMQLLVNTNQIPSLSYGYTAGNQYRLSQVFGSLTLGGYDSNRFTPNNITFPFNADQSRDLSVNLQSITTDAASSPNLLPDGTINIFVDSTIAELWLPLSACEAFEAAFGITWNEQYNHYFINSTQRQKLLAANPNVTLTMGPDVSGGQTLDIVLPYRAFDLNLSFPIVYDPNTTYYFPIIRAQNDTQYTLGRTFLQEAYLIADYDRQNFSIAPCAWEQAQIQNVNLVPILRANETSAHNNDSSGGLSSGAIAGIVVGVVAALALLAVALFVIRRRRNKAKLSAAAEEAAQNKLSTDTNNDGKPFLQQGELGGGEIHEMVAPYKTPAQELDSPYRNDPKNHGYSEMEGGSYFAPSKTYVSEMTGSTPIYEMSGSDVHEMPTPDRPKEQK